MHLYDLPLIFVLVGLALYAVLAGADFGAGLWQLLAGSGERAERLGEHAHEAMAPVWEANHVWLIFVLTVSWTAYPAAFGAVASTLAVPFFLAAVGIILRGAAYALRSGSANTRERRRIDRAFAGASLLTPFALGTMVGAVASRRVPPGNAAGKLFASWLNPTSLTVGALAVCASAYMAAVFMAADAARTGDEQLVRSLRLRALAAGCATGALAVAGLIVLHADAHVLYERMVHREALIGPAVSALAGLATLALVHTRRFEPARYAASLAVAAVIGGWGYAQYPSLLPGLTVAQAAASHDVLVALVVAVLAGALVLFPSLALLFGLHLKGRFDPGPSPRVAARTAGRDLFQPSRAGLATRLALACLVAGFGLLTLAEAGWAHTLGLIALLGFALSGFHAALGVLLASPLPLGDPGDRGDAGEAPPASRASSS
ncbi:MAG TPA: cytochrome d ubiquinol oxidase subunit II [Solirubrobacteraceae bacterium]|jgi:cytochrome d ubiquinol oxidase subunit II